MYIYIYIIYISYYILYNIYYTIYKIYYIYYICMYILYITNNFISIFTLIYLFICDSNLYSRNPFTKTRNYDTECSNHPKAKGIQL